MWCWMMAEQEAHSPQPLIQRPVCLPHDLARTGQFSSGSVCMVLASNKYDEDDYYRDYAEFMRARRKHEDSIP
jgi:hypothetical protein